MGENLALRVEKMTTNHLSLGTSAQICGYRTNSAQKKIHQCMYTLIAKATKFFETPCTFQYERRTGVPVSRYLNLQHWN